MKPANFPARRSLSGAFVAALGIALIPGLATAAPGGDPPPPARLRHEVTPKPFFDARRTATPAGRSGRAATPVPAAVTRLHDSLGRQGIVDIDPVTHTARRVARLDGFLTGPSRKPAETIARAYLTAHPEVFGLSAEEVAALRLRKDYVDVEGTHHLSFQQLAGGVVVFGNGVKADVARDGRLVQVTGSPVATTPAALGAGRLSAAQARDAAARDAGGTSKTSVASAARGADKATVFASGDRAKLVAFAAPGGMRLAWQVLTLGEGYLHVVDAATGRVLYRQSLRVSDNAPSTLAWPHYPGAPAGGTQQVRSLGRWMAPGATTLTGTSSHVFLDVNDNDVADAGEEVGPRAPGDWRFPFKDFTSQVGAPCTPTARCSWDPEVAYSWRDNAAQNAAQLFWFTNTFHDHLAARPIGFTRAAGNYDLADGDPIEVNALDGADTAEGLPDFYHTDNANMMPTPDGVPGRMQMYLFKDPSWPDDPFLAGNSGDEADIVYHEYTHGVSHRLVSDADGNSALTGLQGNAMGEAWSDWYAFDFLAAQGLQRDTAAPGEVLVGRYVAVGQNLIRTQPLDCTVGADAAVCPGAGTAGPGGYTYGDFGKILGFPEVHADGEIWGETLWDLRTALGSKLAESLVTRAMELSPGNPSFLDMRNSILMADRVVHRGVHQGTIWKVFAARGMGWFAAVADGNDITPIEDFSLPPAPNAPLTSVHGTVTDADSHAPLPGATVVFPGHDSGFGGSYSAVADSAGRFTIRNVLPGTYPEVTASGPGYDQIIRDLPVRRGPNRADWSLRRNWATVSGGSEVLEANGDDYSLIGCGPDAALDASQSTGWSTDATAAGDGIEPRHVVVRLPAAVDVSSIAINPSGTCGDDPTSSTGDYRLETSADGTTWTVASEGHFGPADRDRMNPLTLAGTTTGLRYLRYTMLGTQTADEGVTCPDGYSGCFYVDTVEIGVYGNAR
ncbi:M36 family metallopeptidase [Pseudosporangium ferrugineum]|uniref:F5/8 type C domain-containing protein n=1 Tax=Pseudosporangium ferrugineum TaxID=439699 RepID=A0A2T0RQG0_9ACTN|nr:M36 family metallopeptidase [Pseudosporangium ferrugineum]PRY23426.1 F5/8 type C domain-containing protein [Pseudosporangium ferrugineum]